LRSPDPERRRAEYEAFVKDLKAVRKRLGDTPPAARSMKEVPL
jgi:hypothetical protein